MSVELEMELEPQLEPEVWVWKLGAQNPVCKRHDYNLIEHRNDIVAQR